MVARVVLITALAAIAAVAVPAASADPPTPSYSLSQCVLTPAGDHEVATTTAAWVNNQKVSEIDVTYTYDVLSSIGPIVYKTVEASDLHGRNGSVTFNFGNGTRLYGRCQHRRHDPGQIRQRDCNS
jgi:hypothetical protein